METVRDSDKDIEGLTVVLLLQEDDDESEGVTEPVSVPEGVSDIEGE